MYRDPKVIVTDAERANRIMKYIQHVEHILDNVTEFMHLRKDEGLGCGPSDEEQMRVVNNCLNSMRALFPNEFKKEDDVPPPPTAPGEDKDEQEREPSSVDSDKEDRRNFEEILDQLDLSLIHI